MNILQNIAPRLNLYSAAMKNANDCCNSVAATPTIANKSGAGYESALNSSSLSYNALRLSPVICAATLAASLADK